MSGQGTAEVQGEDCNDSLSAEVVQFRESCPYLPGRVATLQGFFASRLQPALYGQLLDHSFRRSGRFFYRPQCDDCNQCRQLRVLVNEFRPSRSQRRCLARNADLRMSVGQPRFTDEKRILYEQYVRIRHQRDPEKEIVGIQEFLYDPVVESVELTFRDVSGRLLAVSICDVMPNGLSSVYSFFDASPEQERRGLGTFTALRELDYAREKCAAYYYLGYLVRGCRAMCYKASFRPYELLDLQGSWKAQQ